ncbi:MAG: ATP synthase epsilon chain [Candidatus Omnitrophica bacterium ADurb.Bin205]|nr:hypothetical protein [Candidatus Omnitrophota bacterium]OQB16460.1 MAG: ATP synthase epsilon chain [Candidatus Omnitrophica bacterium ADurb.Bin205]
MRVSILEPKGAIWEGMANQVMLPAEEGQMCVLDFHQPFVVRLTSGSIAFADMKIAVKDGIAYMRSNSLTVFAQT